MIVSLGKITVATPGTTIQISSTVPTNCNAVYFQALSTNTKYLYVGIKTMVRSTLVGVFRQIPAPTAATGLTVPLPDWTLQSNVFTGPFDLSAIYIDADNATEGLLISYVA